MAWAERRGLMVLHVSFSLLVLMQAASVTTQECETKKIVCEDQSTNINCENGLIKLSTAIYGRNDNITCPHDQVSNTTCGVDVVAVLGTRCNDRSQCRIKASNSLDGDPCPGTYKYLEVAYICKVLLMTTVTTTGPSPPVSVLPMTTVTTPGPSPSASVFPMTTVTTTGPSPQASVYPITTFTTTGPSPSASDTSPTDSISPVIPAIVVFVVVVLIVVISGVICYKRRQLSKSKDRDPHLDAPVTDLNRSFTTCAVDQNDYTGCINPIEGATNAARRSSSEDNQHNEYFELPTSVPPTRQGNIVIYNEVGEQDYNVLFGGKEQGDYHEYNLPESAQKTPSGPYQELLKGGKHDLHGQTKRGVPIETVDQGYQDLRKDDYTSPHLNAKTPTKPESSSSVASMNNTYQALQTSGPDYAILEPNTNDPSPAYPKPGSLPNNDYHSLAKNEIGFDDTASGFDQGGVSMKQEASQDDKYQHLIKDDTTPESMSGNTEAKDQNSTYDVLQHGPKTSEHTPSNGYGSLGMTTETEDLDPGAEPKATSDYEVPKQEISEEPYDHLQRKELPDTSPINPDTMAEKSADDDDYENPSSSLDNETDTYQTLDNLRSQGNDQDGVDVDYSHLQRPLGNTVSPDRTGASDMGNQYGKLNFAFESK